VAPPCGALSKVSTKKFFFSDSASAKNGVEIDSLDHQIKTAADVEFPKSSVGVRLLGWGDRGSRGASERPAATPAFHGATGTCARVGSLRWWLHLAVHTERAHAFGFSYFSHQVSTFFST
jgi:hypothetical protein